MLSPGKRLKRGLSTEKGCVLFSSKPERTSARPQEEPEEDRGDKCRGMLLHFSSWMVDEEGKKEAGMHWALTLCCIRGQKEVRERRPVSRGHRCSLP